LNGAQIKSVENLMNERLAGCICWFDIQTFVVMEYLQDFFAGESCAVGMKVSFAQIFV